MPKAEDMEDASAHKVGASGPLGLSTLASLTCRKKKRCIDKITSVNNSNDLAWSQFFAHQRPTIILRNVPHPCTTRRPRTLIPVLSLVNTFLFLIFTGPVQEH